jgi:predicted aspartyl protease
MEAGMKCRLNIRLVYSTVITLCSLLVVPATAIAGDEENVDRFKISPGDPGLLVPIEFDGKTYQFLVDTGSTMTAFDFKLLGNQAVPKQGSYAQTPSGPVVVPLFDDVPAARLRNNNLQDELSIVGGVNLVDVQKGSGKEIHGILGMDFLKSRIVEINFDDRELLLRKGNSTADASKESLAIAFNELGLPLISGEIVNQAPMEFVIDTGMTSHLSGKIGTRRANYLIGRGDLKVTGTTRMKWLAGSETYPVIRGQSLTLGTHQISRPIFVEAVDEANCLGLNYLSRFHVTMDFPNKRMYLRKGRDFEKPDVGASSADHKLKRDNQALVYSTDPGSIAEKVGTRDGDLLLKINGQDINQIPQSTLRLLNGKVVTQLVQRGNRQVEVVAELVISTESLTKEP